MYLWGLIAPAPTDGGCRGFFVVLAASSGSLRPWVGGVGVCACGLDCLIACGLTQVVAALSLRPSGWVLAPLRGCIS